MNLWHIWDPIEQGGQWGRLWNLNRADNTCTVDAIWLSHKL
jgi:hypothetical protein